MKRVLASFPELQEVLKKPLRDTKAEATCAQVLDILLNARAPEEEVKFLAAKWSAYSNESGATQSAHTIFPLLREFDPNWDEASLAHARLLLHGNKLQPARAILAKMKNSQRAEQLHALTFVREQDAKSLLGNGKLDPINQAALASHLQEENAKALWEVALSGNPHSLAALNGAKRFDEALNLISTATGGDDDLATSEMNARSAQALLGLALQAKDGNFAVTSEGLYRNAISKLEKCVKISKKPVYTLELARAYGAYGNLLKNWEKREEDGGIHEAKAVQLEKSCNSLLPSFAFDLPGWELPLPSE